MQARRLARELALLAMGQLPDKAEQLSRTDLEALLAAAVTALAGEAQDTLERAAADLQRGEQQLLDSDRQTIAVDAAGPSATELAQARLLIQEALTLAQKAINDIGNTLQLPVLIQSANQKEVRSYAVELLSVTASRKEEVDEGLNQAMERWQMKRLPQLDRDLLRLAVVEMAYLGVPDAVAINEAVELAKTYSDQDGYRFINGALRRWLTQFRQMARAQAKAQSQRPLSDL